jgi:hypothetical protein
MSLPTSNAAFAVYPGSSGAMFIMPDGSLWRWGTGVTSADRLPELLDDRRHWTNVFYVSGNWLVQESNGNIWEVPWGGVPSTLSPLTLPGTNQDWADLTGGVMYGLGLHRDGTILGWELNSGLGGKISAPTAVETNYLWRALSASGPSCIGVSDDGGLWTWQRAGFSPLTFLPPTPASTGTNWIGVDQGGYAWSSTGELWGTCVAHLNSPNAIRGRFTLGTVVHEIRADGSLWAIGWPSPRRVWSVPVRTAAGGASASFSSFSAIGARSARMAPTGNGPLGSLGQPQWRRIGERTDWVSIWGYDETYFGLTADGTVWVWGIDWARIPRRTWNDKLADLWEQIQERFQPSTGVVRPMTGRMAMRRAGRLGTMVTQPYQEEPRPFMRFQPAAK